MVVAGADDLDVVQRILGHVHTEKARTILRRVSRTWRFAHHHVSAGPRILVLVEEQGRDAMQLLICDEAASLMGAFAFTSPTRDGVVYEGSRLKEVREPMCSLRNVTVVGDLAIVAYREGWLQAIDLRSRAQRWLKHVSCPGDTSLSNCRIECVAASPNGGQSGCLALGVEFGDVWIVLCDPATGLQMRAMQAPIARLSCITLNHRATKVAVGALLGDMPAATTNGVVVMSTATGEVLHRIGACHFVMAVNSIAFCAPDRLVTGSNDSMIKLWSLEGALIKKPLFTSRCQDWVKSVAASPDERFVVCCSNTRDRRRTVVSLFESWDEPEDALALTATEHSPWPCHGTFCDAGLLLTPTSSFESGARRVALWPFSHRGFEPNALQTRGFICSETTMVPRNMKKTVIAATAWSPSPLFRDYAVPPEP